MWEESAISLEKAAPARDTRKLYQTLKETTRKKVTASEVAKDNQGKIISSQNGRMIRLKQHFQSIAKFLSFIPLWRYSPICREKPYDVWIERSEILKTIKILKNHKSSGEDGLPPGLYKKCPEVTAE